MKKWIDVDYWIVETADDEELFRGTQSQCRKKLREFKKKFGNIHVAHVILEKEK